MNADRKGARRNLRIQGPFVRLRDPIELHAVIRNQPREDIQAPGTALRIRFSGHLLRKAHPFHERHDIDMVTLEYLRRRKVQLDDIVPLLLQAGEDRRLRARQETGPDAVRPCPQPQIQTRWLELDRFDRPVRRYLPLIDGLFDLLYRHHACRLCIDGAGRLRIRKGFSAGVCHVAPTRSYRSAARRPFSVFIRVVPLDNFMIYKDIIRLDRPD